MARITVDDCMKLIPNRFELTLAATYRARQLTNERCTLPRCHRNQRLTDHRGALAAGCCIGLSMYDNNR